MTLLSFSVEPMNTDTTVELSYRKCCDISNFFMLDGKSFVVSDDGSEDRMFNIRWCLHQKELCVTTVINLDV